MTTIHQNLDGVTAPALVALIRATRPGWDERPILNALRQLHDRGSLAYVTWRCLVAASDPQCQTPAGLLFDQWWDRRDPDAPRRRNTGPTNLGAPNGVTDPDTIAARAAAARAAIRRDIRTTPQEGDQ